MAFAFECWAALKPSTSSYALKEQVRFSRSFDSDLRSDAYVVTAEFTLSRKYWILKQSI
jgi:hypothetical protein